MDGRRSLHAEDAAVRKGERHHKREEKGGERNRGAPVKGNSEEEASPLQRPHDHHRPNLLFAFGFFQYDTSTVPSSDEEDLVVHKRPFNFFQEEILFQNGHYTSGIAAAGYKEKSTKDNIGCGVRIEKNVPTTETWKH